MQQQLQQELSDIKELPFLVFHDAYQYFENHFQLNNRGAITLNPELGSSAKQIQKIRHIIEEQDIKCVFSEPQFDTSIIDIVAEGASVKISVLDPLGSSVPVDKDLYLTLLSQIGQSLSGCLSQ